MHTPIPSSLYKEIAARWVSGVTIITAAAPDGAGVGTTVSAFTPLSLDPPQFLVSLALGSRTLAAIRRSGRFCINLLAEDQADHCARFADAGDDRFETVAHSRTPSGLPVLDGGAAHVECLLETVHESGDHAILIGAAVSGAAADVAPLAYCRSRLTRLAPCM